MLLIMKYATVTLDSENRGFEHFCGKVSFYGNITISSNMW